jgi:TPR repeat protein
VTIGTLDWLQQTAEQGELEAMVSLGDELAKNPKTTATAIQWYRKAAQLGVPSAQFKMAMVLKHGTGVEQNLAESITWLNRAATQESAPALLELAICHMNGSGVTADPTRAVQLLTQACDLHDADAQALMGAILITGDGIRPSLTNGIKLLKTVAESGNSFAQWRLALCFKHGLGVNKDSLEGDRWFTRAAEGRFDQGLPWPCNNPSFRFDSAVKMFQTMADVGNKQALHWLGICYELALVVSADRERAFQLYRSSAAKGYAPAQNEMTRLGVR